MDWLLDHRFEFTALYTSALGDTVEVDWSEPRLLCIAADFTRFDEYAIEQIDRNIELIRYQKFEYQILFELTKTVTGSNKSNKMGSADGGAGGTSSKYAGHTLENALAAADAGMMQLFSEIEDYCLGLGEDARLKQLKYYWAFARVKNFLCVDPRTRDRKFLLYCKAELPPEAEH